jgi:hypothetical protein
MLPPGCAKLATKHAFELDFGLAAKAPKRDGRHKCHYPNLDNTTYHRHLFLAAPYWPNDQSQDDQSEDEQSGFDLSARGSPIRRCWLNYLSAVPLGCADI